MVNDCQNILIVNNYARLRWLFTVKTIEIQYQNVHFLAHLVYQPKNLIQSCFVHCHHWHHPASASLSVHTSPWHMVRHRNFILGTHMHICPPYVHIKYLMILTYGFLNGSHFGVFLSFAFLPT